MYKRSYSNKKRATTTRATRTVARRAPRRAAAAPRQSTSLIDAGARLAKRYGRPVMKTIGGGLGGLLGGAFTGGAGTGVGAGIGSAIADTAATILGMGAYEIKENSLLTSSQVPVMHDVGNSIRIKHREYVADVYSSSTPGSFDIKSYALNPGLSASFPWLCNVASAFEQYKVEGFAVEFKSGSGDALNSTNTALGSVILAADYNAGSTGFTNKQQMLNSMWACEAKPSQNIVMPIECDPKENPFGILYNRNGPVREGEDQRLYDLCTISIATTGCQGTSVNLGSMWFTYDILLKKPTSLQSSGLALKSAAFSTTTSSTGIDNTNWFKSLSSEGVYGGDNIGVTLTPDSIIQMPSGLEGAYLISYYARSAPSGARLVSAPTMVLTNCTLQTWFSGGTASVLTNADPSYPTTAFTLEFVISVTDSSLPVSIRWNTDGNPPTSPTTAELMINQVNPEIFA